MSTITFHLNDGNSLSMAATDDPAWIADFFRSYIEGADMRFTLAKAPPAYRHLRMGDVARIEVQR